MNLLQNSLIFSAVVAFWDFICRRFNEGLFGAFVHRIRAMFKRGFVCRVLNYESKLDRTWHDTLFYRVMKWLVDLIPNLLGRLVQKFPEPFNSSICYRILCCLGENSSLLIGFMLMMLLVVPQDYWNNLYSLIGASGILMLFFIAGSRNKALRIELENIGLWPVMFGFISCLSLLWSQHFTYSIRFLFFNLTCIFVVLVGVSSIKTEDQLYDVAVLCCLGLCICCGYAFLQRIVGVEASSSFTDLEANAKMPGRVYSFFENPNAFANIIVYFAPLMFALAFYGKKLHHRILFGLAFILCCGAILMTYSRGGWLALLVAGFVLVLFLCPRWVPLFVLMALATVPFWPSSITARILTIFSSDSSISGRTYIYTAMVRIIRENWLFGVGLGTSALRRAVHCYGAYYADFPFIHGHNIYMEIWGESGIFALIAFLLTMFFPVRDASRVARRSESKTLRAIAAGCVSGVIGSLVFGITDYAWTYPRIMVLFWFLFVMLCSAIKIYRNSHGAPNEKEGNVNE